jgi:hypothetical protein
MLNRYWSSLSYRYRNSLMVGAGAGMEDFLAAIMLPFAFVLLCFYVASMAWTMLPLCCSMLASMMHLWAGIRGKSFPVTNSLSLLSTLGLAGGVVILTSFSLSVQYHLLSHWCERSLPLEGTKAPCLFAPWNRPVCSVNRPVHAFALCFAALAALCKQEQSKAFALGIARPNKLWRCR